MSDGPLFDGLPPASRPHVGVLEGRRAERKAEADDRRKQRAIAISVFVALVLTCSKLGVAMLTGSVAVLSETVHSLTDLLAAGIAYLALRRAAEPPDSRHRYGHGKVENASAIAEGIIVLLVIGLVIAETVRRLVHGTSPVELPLLAAGVMGISAAVNFVVATHLRRVARSTGSAAVMADAQHLMTDVWSAGGACIGLIIVWATGIDALDPIVALVVAMPVVSIGLRLVWTSLQVLMDAGLPDSELQTIQHAIDDACGSRANYHRLRTRRAGSRRHVDLHLTLDGNATLHEAHDISHRVEQSIHAALPNVDVLIHVEPDTVAPPPGEDVGPGDRL
jgi:cation diffusion facilitator family transporter